MRAAVGARKAEAEVKEELEVELELVKEEPELDVDVEREERTGRRGAIAFRRTDTPKISLIPLYPHLFFLFSTFPPSPIYHHHSSPVFTVPVDVPTHMYLTYIPRLNVLGLWFFFGYWFEWLEFEEDQDDLGRT
ncbi:hypothetical protein C8R45DRAFT_953586 [Mycena sanguinolenta]|nr:hypothetical protein C8R45DRAFT_953586 [Mycena sanguinolenta]